MQKLLATTLATLALTMIGITHPGSSWPCNAVTGPCHGPVHPL
jgi:hypothetical protein